MIPENGLVRLRADPAKVQIGIRRCNDGRWMASISIRNRPVRMELVAWVSSCNPVRAIESVLRHAAKNGIDRIDLQCLRAYRHPQFEGEAT